MGDGMQYWNYVSDASDCLIPMLFNNAISTTDALLYHMNWEGDFELWIGKNLEEGNCGLFQCTVPVFSWRDWRPSWKSQSGRA
jgi:hypothetical protein